MDKVQEGGDGVFMNVGEVKSLRIVLAALVTSGVCGASAYAQTPVHQHYERSDAMHQPGPAGVLAPRLQNLGAHTFKVTTKSARAQLFVNQGLNLAYGFNHAEAGRAFAEAARLDPGCAMAYWGQALVLGPNINAAMAPEDEPKALALVQTAASLARGATARERDYIDALAKRYTGKPDGRQAGDRAFAEAMRALTKKYPRDLDAATIFAEALMDLRPWNYWTRDGLPNEGTAEAIAALERVIAANPKHPGALHYWIHLWEPTQTPERAEREADRLLPLMPGAGHIVHMPAHIYLRVGRYADVVTSNQQAVAADEEYIAQCRAQGMYPLGVLSPQPSFRVARRDDVGAEPAGPGVGTQGRLVGRVGDAGTAAVRSGIPRRALLRHGAVRTLGRDACRATTDPRDALHAGDVALRARVGVLGARPVRPGRRGTRGASGDRRRPRAGEDAAVFPQSAR